jgi:general secretion pathway protein L
MANTIFALDIHDDLVTGVVVKTVGKTRLVTACGIVEVGSQPLETAVSEVISQVGSSEGDCRVALGAEQFFYRNFNFPFTDTSKITKILPGELAENAPVESANMIFDYLLAGQKGREAAVIAAIADSSFISEHLQMLQGLSIDPEIIGVSGTFGATGIVGLAGVPEDYIYLDVGFRRAVLVAIIAGQISLVRPLVFDTGQQAGFRLTEENQDVSVLRPENLQTVIRIFAQTVRQTLQAARIGMRSQDLPLYLAGPVGAYPGLAEALQDSLGLEVKSCGMLLQPMLKIEDAAAARWQAGAMERALALALAPGKSRREFNFRKDAFRKKGSLQDLRRYARLTALPLALLVLLLVAFVWRDHAQLRENQRALDAQIRDIFSQTLPDVTRIVNPVQQIQTRIDEAKNAYMTGGTTDTGLGMLALLAEISARIPTTLQVRIVKMTADQKDVRLKGTTENFNIVDNVQKELEKSPYFSKVEISSANSSVKTGTIDFEIKLDLRR